MFEKPCAGFARGVRSDGVCDRGIPGEDQDVGGGARGSNGLEARPAGLCDAAPGTLLTGLTRVVGVLAVLA